VVEHVKVMRFLRKRRGEDGVLPGAAEHLTEAHVEWAYRLILDRPAEQGIAARFAAHFPNTRSLREYMLASVEYSLKNGPGATAQRMGDAVVIALLDSYGVKGRLFVNLADLIGLSVARGEYEREEIAFLQRNLRPGDTFVDVGANIGFFSVVASARVGKPGCVFAFEALSSNIASMKLSLAENSFCENVKLHQVILADEPRSDMFIASQSLEDGSRNSGGGFIVTETDILPDAIKREAIPQDTLDNLIPRDVHVNFIKADIEGAEFLAMRGAERILRDGAPIILSEVHVDQLFKISKKTWREYFDFMHGFGYRAHFIEHGELAGEASDLQAGKVYNVAFVRP
jgi:FkbM family methyltransferase